MPFAEYESYDGLGLAELVANDDVKPEELLDAAIERADARNPVLNAIPYRWDDEARASIAGGAAAGAVPRRAVFAQGPGDALRRPAHEQRLRPLRRVRRRPRQ